MKEGRIRVSTDRLKSLADRFSDQVSSLQKYFDDLKSIPESFLQNEPEVMEELAACIGDFEKLNGMLKKSAKIYEEGEKQIRNLLSEL